MSTVDKKEVEKVLMPSFFAENERSLIAKIIVNFLENKNIKIIDVGGGASPIYSEGNILNKKLINRHPQVFENQETKRKEEARKNREKNKQTKRIKKTTKPLKDLFGKYSLIYSTNPSSGAVDAYLANQPLIIHHDLRFINLSPLSKINKINFIHNAKDLSYSLQIKNTIIIP